MATDAWLNTQTAYRNKNVEAAYEQMVKTLKLSPKPILIRSSPENAEDVGLASARETQSGRTFIIVGNSPGITEKDQIATLAHELGHIAKGHTKPQHLADSMNRDEATNEQIGKTPIKSFEHEMQLVRALNPQSKANEHEADAVAASLCQGNATADFYQKILDASKFNPPESLKIPGLSIEQSLEVADTLHPPLPERIAALREGAKANEAIGNCPASKPSGRNGR